MSWKGKVSTDDPTKRKRTSFWLSFYFVIIWSDGLFCSRRTLANTHIYCPASIFTGYGYFSDLVSSTEGPAFIEE